MELQSETYQTKAQRRGCIGTTTKGSGHLGVRFRCSVGRQVERRMERAVAHDTHTATSSLLLSFFLLPVHYGFVVSCLSLCQQILISLSFDRLSLHCSLRRWV